MHSDSITIMEHLMQSLALQINEGLYIKNPDSTALGKKIVGESIILINEIGFERFTFRKLGSRIGSNESSVYRYFENKHKLLLYLASWYWGWLEYKFVFETHNLPDAVEKLRKGIEIVTGPIKLDAKFDHIDEVKLSRVIINEFSKSYMTKEVDRENKEGYFAIYKRMVHRLVEMIKEVSPEYPYPCSLASGILEGALHQSFLKEHFPQLTDCFEGSDVSEYFIHLTFNTLNLPRQ